MTKREQKVVRLVTEGRTNPEIAKVFDTTNNMVKNYMRVIFDKTGMSTRLELALWHLKREQEKRS